MLEEYEEVLTHHASEGADLQDCADSYRHIARSLERISDVKEAEELKLVCLRNAIKCYQQLKDFESCCKCFLTVPNAAFSNLGNPLLVDQGFTRR